jgi:hypothetical protein
MSSQLYARGYTPVPTRRWGHLKAGNRNLRWGNWQENGCGPSAVEQLLTGDLLTTTTY